jgi:hypothetical protein
LDDELNRIGCRSRRETRGEVDDACLCGRFANRELIEQNAIGLCECLRIARFSISQELNRDFQRACSSRACGRCVCEIVACSHVRVARRGKRES